jgi:hypothetical protein
VYAQRMEHDPDDYPTGRFSVLDADMEPTTWAETFGRLRREAPKRVEHQMLQLLNVIALLTLAAYTVVIAVLAGLSVAIKLLVFG